MMVPPSRSRSPLQALDLMMKLAVVFAMSWFLYASFNNRPPAPSPELQRAVAALKKGDEAGARTEFDRFLAAHPDNAAATIQVSILCHEAHRIDLMTDYLQQGMKKRTNADGVERAQLLAQLALALSESGKPQQARAAAREAQTLAPDDPEILNQAGYVLADTSTDSTDLNDASKMISRALTILAGRSGIEDPTGFLAVVEDSYGWVLYKQGLCGPPAVAQTAYAHAVTALLQAITDLPADAPPEAAKTVYYHLGAAYHRIGQIEAARDALAVALHYDPHYPEALEEQRQLALPSPASPSQAHAFTPLPAPAGPSQTKL